MGEQPAGVGAIGVVGAGTMGAGIAQVALEAGEHVVIHDPEPGAVERARERIADGLARRARRRITEGALVRASTTAAMLDGLEIAADLETVARSARVVVEAAIEDLAVKRSVFARLDAAADPATILATNTSALSVTAIASATSRPGRVIGLHFFNPAPLMALVEVVAHPTVDPGVVATATELVTGWGKTAVRTADAPGFIVNRVNRPFTLEALALLEAGSGSVASIDLAVRSAGFPMGPFELMDLVGIDVNLAAARAIFAAMSYEPRFRPSEIQERLVEAGRFGRKSGEGFYWYGEDGRPIGVAGAFAASDEPPPHGQPEPPSAVASSAGSTVAHAAMSDAVVERIVLAIIDEAYRALGDHVASRSDIDLALRLGAAHPRGPFEWVTDLGGARAVLGRLERWRSAGPRFDPAPALVEAAATER
jgi:3-hydroxybutyryl-CoA dehydrogenase